MTNDEWVNARAQQLYLALEKRLKWKIDRLAAIDTALQEAIERGKAEQDKDVAAAYRKGWKRCYTLFLARLDNPDEALVEAVQPWLTGWTREDLADITRALARTLTEGEEKSDERRD